MKTLIIRVPSASAIEMHLSSFPHLYRAVSQTSTWAEFSYSGVIPPLAKISQLLSSFDPIEYTISKSTTGISFIVWSL